MILFSAFNYRKQNENWLLSSALYEGAKLGLRKAKCLTQSMDCVGSNT